MAPAGHWQGTLRSLQAGRVDAAGTGEAEMRKGRRAERVTAEAENMLVQGGIFER